ncbi:MAG: T9SS type A sorting domain-containing protein [Saprospiraceae bacterium]
MKLQRLLPTLLAVFSFAVLAEAQTAYLWDPVTVPSCQAGTTINSTNDFQWQSIGCVDAELSASNDVITFTDDSNTGGAAYPVISGTQTANSNTSNVLPGTVADAGVLSWTVTGDLSAVLMEQSMFIVLLAQTNGVVQQVYVPFEGLGNPLDCGVQLVAGGSIVTIAQVQIVRDTGWASIPFDLTFSYTYTPTSGLLATMLNGVSVPDSDFNGTTYEHVLPAGVVNLLPVFGVFDVGLENNTPTEQVINISKSGGALIVAGSAQIRVQEATATMEPHEVNVMLDSVGICLGNSEFIVEEGASLTLSNVPLTYDGGISCLGAHANGRIVIAEGASQTFGDQGQGMQLWDGNSVTEIRENATLTLENAFYLTGFEDAYFDVLPGATLDVTEYTRVFGGSARDEQLVVRLHDGGTFDMDSAPREVQVLFRVEAVSSNQNLMPEGTFTAFPNPAQEGVTFVHTGTESRQLTQIEVVDLSGRIISTERPASNNAIYPVALPGAGLYVIRLTDIDGRVGHIRVVGK